MAGERRGEDSSVETGVTRREIPASAGPRGANAAPRDEHDVPTATIDSTPGTRTSGFPEGWGRYLEAAFLGEGGMGEVYKAWDPRLTRYVALKFLGRRKPRAAERLLAEAQAQARVEHENICKVYEVGDANGRPYIAMQLIDGMTLGKAAKQMSLADHIYVVRKVAEAVHAAHAQGLIHRDLKPANIMVEQTEKGFRPTVLDFGIARELGSTERREIAGTPAFMSPEQARGETGDRRVDVWGLGVVLHTLLAGAPPGTTPLPATVPADLRAITQQCLQIAPERRYPSAAAVAEDLRRFADGEPISAHPPSLLYRAGKRLRKHKALAAVAVVAVVVVGTFGALALRERALTERRVALAQRFGHQVARLETQMRQAYGAPLHDVRRERQLVLARMASIDAEASSFGDVARGPAAYAVGRAHLSLHDVDRAHDRLEDAWRTGYRAPELSYALGLALGQKYQRALIETRRITDPVQRERAQAQLRRTLRDPALEQLRAARGTDLEAPAYVEGLIAYYEGNYTLALAKAQEAFDAAPWLYEARALEGDVYTADATDKLARGDYEAARTAATTGLTAYVAAEALAPSDAALLDAQCEGRRVGLLVDISQGRVTAAQFDDAVAPCDRAHVADPEMTEPLVRGARILSSAADVLWTSRGIAPEPLVERVVARANEAIAARPTLAKAWYSRAVAISIRGRAEGERGTDPTSSFNAANQDFEKAIALDPELSSAYAEECITYQHIADWVANREEDPLPALERAIAIGKRGIAADPENLYAHRSLGTAWLRRGMWESDHNIDPASSLEQAAKAYASVLAVNPKDPSTINNDAIVRDMVGTWRLDHGLTEGERDLDRAEASYREALRLGGEDSDTLNNLGHMCWTRARYYLHIGRDVRVPVDAGLAYLGRARKTNPNEVNVYFNEIQLHEVLAEAVVRARSSPAQQVEAALAAIAAHRGVNPHDVDVDAFEADAHILAARGAMLAGRDPSPDFALAEKALARAAAGGEPTAYTLTAKVHLHRDRAEWLVASGRSATADLAAGDAAVAKLVAIDHGTADTRLLAGVLALLRARAAGTDATARRDAATRARTELDAAVNVNRFLEPEVKPLRSETETLAR